MGEVVVITGPIGAGKSTVARLVADRVAGEGRSTADVPAAEVADAVAGGVLS